MSGNTGHGHVIPRPDGLRARCGGPGFCKVCQTERAALEMTTNTTPSTASQAPAVSIGSKEFRQLAANWVRAEHYAHPTPSPKVEAFRALIAHIDAQMVKDHNRGYAAGYEKAEKELDLMPLIFKINDEVLKVLPRHPCTSIMSERYSKVPFNVLLNVESLIRYFKDAQKAEARATAAEAKLEAIRQGVEGLKRYLPSVGYPGRLFEAESGIAFKCDDVLALLRPQHQADESGLP